MAEHDYNIANADGATFRADLNNLASAIVSNNSGLTAPSTTFAYQWWADTTTGLLKQRNSANSAWITIGTMASTNLGLATLASPTFTGTPAAPTAAAATNTTQLATTAFVQQELGGVGAWTTYTPTVTSASGTLTSASATGRYKIIGTKLVAVQTLTTITTNGTGATAIRNTLPFTAAAAQFTLSGYESGSTGKAIGVQIASGGTTMNMRFYDGTYPGADGYLLLTTGVYEIA